MVVAIKVLDAALRGVNNKKYFGLSTSNFCV
jgi:hypothetical protein